MSIDLRKFVDVNIKQHVDRVVSGTRGITSLFTSYGVKGTTNIISNMSEMNTLYQGKSGTTNLLAYAEIYFEHGGSKLLIYEGYNSVSKDDITDLPDEQILIAFSDLSYADIKALAQSIAADATIYGIKEKILFGRTNILLDSDSISNFAVKYGMEVGSEMTMPAYLSQIDVYGTNTVFDYAFTQESVHSLALTDAQFDTIMNNNMNVDVYLANATRVCGGNCKNGVELTNNFVRIILHQTLTDRLVALLTQKIKSTTGLGKMYATLTQELASYLTCGYLTTDKVWLDEDLVVNVNNQSYTIIEKGTALTNGYIIKILPMTSLSQQDKTEHKAPLVYVIVADQYAIRKITINGEVI